jgi:RNA polymerase sigma-70 factor (ECF subfamily)
MTERTITYCIVPRDLAGELHELLRHHWGDDPGIVVVVERRTSERRGRERRQPGARPPEDRERRVVRSPAGRRVAERRAAKSRVLPPPLPPGARRHAQRLVFIQRRVPRGQTAEDLETARLVVEYQLGDRSTFEEIYLRYFDRVYAYARMAVQDPGQAEDVTQRVFARVLKALPGYRIQGRLPFRAWLFRIVRETILGMRDAQLTGRREPLAVVEVHQEAASPAAEEALRWLSDADLYRLVERLPASQREVLVVRYFLDLSNEEAAATLDRSPGTTRMLLSRALRNLVEAMAAEGRGRGRSSRSPMRRCAAHSPVISARRRALHGGTRGGGLTALGRGR